MAGGYGGTTPRCRTYHTLCLIVRFSSDLEILSSRLEQWCWHYKTFEAGLANKRWSGKGVRGSGSDSKDKHGVLLLYSPLGCPWLPGQQKQWWKSCFPFSGKIWLLLLLLFQLLPTLPIGRMVSLGIKDSSIPPLYPSKNCPFFIISPFPVFSCSPKALQLAAVWELNTTGWGGGGRHGRHHRAGLARRGQRYDAAITGTWRGSGIDQPLERLFSGW